MWDRFAYWGWCVFDWFMKGLEKAFIIWVVLFAIWIILFITGLLCFATYSIITKGFSE